MSTSLINRIEVRLSSVSREGGSLGSPSNRKKEVSRFIYEDHEDNLTEGEVIVKFNGYFTLHFILGNVDGSLTDVKLELGDNRTVYRLSVEEMLKLLNKKYGE